MGSTPIEGNEPPMHAGKTRGPAQARRRGNHGRTSRVGHSSLTAPLLLVLLPAAHALTHQVNYNAAGHEYCRRESINLGTCLGQQQAERSDYSDVQMLQCLECSGRFQGDETCDELKALNDVELLPNGTEESINWNESFCEQYGRCVEENCPEQCLREQDAWLECLILELDCDWRCEGATWLNLAGGRTVGMSMMDGLRWNGGLGTKSRVGGGAVGCILLGVAYFAGTLVV